MRGHARVSLSRERLTRYLTLTRYLIEALAVVLHMCVAFVPQLLLIYYALAMQHTWAVLMCPAGGIDGKPVKIVYADTKSDPAQGANAAIQVLEQGADMLVVSCDFDMGAPAAPERMCAVERSLSVM